MSEEKPYLIDDPNPAIGMIAQWRDKRGEQLNVFQHDTERFPSMTPFHAIWSAGDQHGQQDFDDRDEVLAFAVQKAEELGLPPGDHFEEMTPEEAKLFALETAFDLRKFWGQPICVEAIELYDDHVYCNVIPYRGVKGTAYFEEAIYSQSIVDIIRRTWVEDGHRVRYYGRVEPTAAELAKMAEVPIGDIEASRAVADSVKEFTLNPGLPPVQMASFRKRVESSFGTCDEGEVPALRP